MRKKEVVNEIVNFCFEFGIFKSPFRIKQIKNNIEKQLDDVVFIENLINTIFVKAKERKILRTKRAMNLLIELEKIRISLEDKGSYK